MRAFEQLNDVQKRLAEDDTGGVAIIVALSLPVLLGAVALGLEYSNALVTKSHNQRVSDTAAYAAAFEYNKKRSTDANINIAAATRAARSVAALNGVETGVDVRFNAPEDATYVDVVISQDQTVILSRLIQRNDTLTIRTSSRVSLGEAAGFTACILSLDRTAREGFRVNGNSGTYNLDGCGIGANAEITVNGGFLETSCAAPAFNRASACREQEMENDFADPFSDVTNWPYNSNNDLICDHTGSLLTDLSRPVGGRGNGKSEYYLKPGVLCVDDFPKKLETVSSEPGGLGSTLIFKAGVNFEMQGNESFSIKPPDSGEFEGVAIYAPGSTIRMSGNPDFSIDGLSCSGLVAGSMRFDGNVALNAQCDEEDRNFGAGGKATQPRLTK